VGVCASALTPTISSSNNREPRRELNERRLRVCRARKESEVYTRQFSNKTANLGGIENLGKVNYLLEADSSRDEMRTGTDNWIKRALSYRFAVARQKSRPARPSWHQRGLLRLQRTGSNGQQPGTSAASLHRIRSWPGDFAAASASSRVDRLAYPHRRCICVPQSRDLLAGGACEHDALSPESRPPHTGPLSPHAYSGGIGLVSE
jgi:hypothetical protein